MMENARANFIPGPDTMTRIFSLATFSMIVVACSGDGENDKELSAITPEESIAICERAVADFVDSDAQRVLCYANAIALAASDPAVDCESEVQECLGRPVSVEPACRPFEQVDIDAFPQCATDVTVGQFEACQLAIVTTLSDTAADVSCDSDPDALAQTPDSCLSLAEMCPSVYLDAYQRADISVHNPNQLDVLFVLDNSSGMGAFQTDLIEHFQRFIDRLASPDERFPSLHIGVISTDLGTGPFAISGCEEMGDAGRLQSEPRIPGCSPPDDRYIVESTRPDGSHERNYEGTLAETFSCIARLGTDGCEFTQPLEAMRMALDGSQTDNAGFLRPDAYLAIVLVTSADDCSADGDQLFDTSQTEVDSPLGPANSFRCFEFGVVCDPDNPRTPGTKSNCRPRTDNALMHDIDRYVDFLSGLKNDPSRVFVTTMTGNANPVLIGFGSVGEPTLEPVCSDTLGDAAPNVRLRALVDALSPERTDSHSICAPSLSLTMSDVGALAGRTTSKGLCLQGSVLDIDPRQPGLQPSCDVVSEESNVQRTLSWCSNLTDPANSENLPCYAIRDDTPECEGVGAGQSISAYFEPGSLETGSYLLVDCHVD